MSVRGFLTFEAPGLPEAEAVEGPPPGRDHADVILAGVRAAGIAVRSGVEPHEAYGWSFVAVVDDVPIWCMLQPSDAWLLITKPVLGTWSRLLGKSADAQHRRVCEAIYAAIRRLPGVSSVRWHSEQEFKRRQAGGEHP